MSSEIVPYYEADGVTVYNARWEDVLAAGLIVPREIALIHADPPYGVKERTARRSNGRGNMAECNDFPPCTGDDKPYDPAELLAIGRPTVLWGANHYASRLPDSPSWITWDKRDEIPSNDNADCEHAWTNLGGPARKWTHVWNGMIKASERTSRRIGSTQKPIALSTYVFGRAKLKPGDLVFVPYLGSGPDLPAARAMGLRLIGCDVEEWCCRTAVARLGAAPHPVPTNALGPLFA